MNHFSTERALLSTSGMAKKPVSIAKMPILTPMEQEHKLKMAQIAVKMVKDLLKSEDLMLALHYNATHEPTLVSILANDTAVSALAGLGIHAVSTHGDGAYPYAVKLGALHGREAAHSLRAALLNTRNFNLATEEALAKAKQQALAIHQPAPHAVAIAS